MTSKQPLSSILDHVNFKLDKMVDEIKKVRSTIASQLQLFEQTQFKSDEQYVEKKDRLVKFLNNDLVKGIRRGRGFIKKKFDGFVRELRHIHDDQIGLTDISDTEEDFDYLNQSYDKITQADIEFENTTNDAFKQEFSDDEDFDKLLDLENRQLFGVRKLFTFGKTPTDLDYIVGKNEFFIVSDNKVIKIRKADQKNIEDDITFNDLKDLKTKDNKKWVSRLIYVPSKCFINLFTSFTYSWLFLAILGIF